MNTFFAFFINIVFHATLTFFWGFFLAWFLQKLFKVKSYRTRFLVQWCVLILPVLDLLKYNFSGWIIPLGLNPLIGEAGSRTLSIGFGFSWPLSFFFNTGFLFHHARFSLADLCFLSLPTMLKIILGFLAFFLIIIGCLKALISIGKHHYFKKKIFSKGFKNIGMSRFSTSLQMMLKENHLTIATSPYVKTPCLIKISKKPKIIFPQQLIGKKISNSEVEAILFHEIAHVFGKDIFLSFWQEMLKKFFWFIPFFKRLAKKAELHRELFCDQHALSMGVKKQKLMHACVVTAQASQVGVAFASRCNFLLRVEKISTMEPRILSENRVKISLFWILFFLFGFFAKFFIF